MGGNSLLPTIPGARAASADPGTAFEAGLFAAGALKNVSADADNARALAKLGAVGALTTVLKRQLNQVYIYIYIYI